MAVRKISSRACLESNATRHCSTDAQERTVSKLETLAKKLGVPLRFGTLVGKYPQTIILDYKYQDSAVSVSSNGSFEINGEKFGHYSDQYFDFSDVDVDDVKSALLSLKAEAGEEESLNESDDVWSTPESAAKSLFDRGLVASDYVERACKRHGKDNNFAHEVGVIIDQMVEEECEDEFEVDQDDTVQLDESKDVYLDSQTRYELEQVLDYLEDSAGAFKKILSNNRWNETATDSLVDDMKDCFNRVKKIAYSLDPERYSMFDGR